MPQKLVIIAAGGTGSRLNADLPKQYMLLNKKPVLMHTIEAFVGIADKIVLAIHPKMIDYWKELCLSYSFEIPHELVEGGSTRFQSVQNSVSYLKKKLPENIFSTASIAIHDAARPLVSRELIAQSYWYAQQGKSVSLAIRSTNSIRLGNIETSESVDRNTVWQVQTPQTFPAKIIKEAYEQQESPLFTDDCSVVEKLGYAIHLIESSSKNIKLTFAEDFDIAQVYLNKNN